MKKNTKKVEFLEQLKKIPIIQVAAEKTGLSRNTIYRWRKEGNEFRKLMDEALAEGEELVNDLSEGQLLTLIKEKNWSALSFWLRYHHPKYGNKLELTGKLQVEEQPLSSQQKELIAKALKFAGLGDDSKLTDNNEQEST